MFNCSNCNSDRIGNLEKKTIAKWKKCCNQDREKVTEKWTVFVVLFERVQLWWNFCFGATQLPKGLEPRLDNSSFLVIRWFQGAKNK